MGDLGHSCIARMRGAGRSSCCCVARAPHLATKKADLILAFAKCTIVGELTWHRLAPNRLLKRFARLSPVRGLDPDGAEINLIVLRGHADLPTRVRRRPLRYPADRGLLRHFGCSRALRDTIAGVHLGLQAREDERIAQRGGKVGGRDQAATKRGDCAVLVATVV